MAMRCGSRIVNEGAFKFEVLTKCGEPAFVDERVEYGVTRLYPPRHNLSLDYGEPLVIEEWTYDFGPRKFKRLLRFENGILEQIRVLDYGH